MKKQTLKALIDFELEQCKEKVHKLIDMHAEEEGDWTPTPGSTFVPVPGSFTAHGEKVPYSLICSCNPANGGDGICGCTIGNTMVDVTVWPRTYTSSSTTTANEN